MQESQLDDIEKIWNVLFMNIKGEKPTCRLTELVKSRWPKLHEMVMKRQRQGFYVQVAMTGLLEQSGVEIVGVESGCDCAECIACERRQDRPHDVDVLVKIKGREVPIQVSIFYGTRAHDPDRVRSELGGVNTELVNEWDTKLVRKKIRQTPPGGITLLATNDIVSPGDDWWYDGVDGRCVVLLKIGSCSIYHGIGGYVDAARELCSTLGYKHVVSQTVKPRRSRNPEHEKRLQFHPKTADGLAAAVRNDVKKWTDNADDVIGALYYPAYASAYFEGLQNATSVVQVNNLVPIIQHVVERHKESVAEDAVDEEEWWHSVSGMMRTLEKLAKADDSEFSVNALVEICHILQDVASRRHDDDACKTLSMSEIDSRLHLKALFCLTYMVYRLRDRTPPEVRKTLTAATRTGGQEGREHRIVFGHALDILRSAIPDWYAENESSLFGEDSPDGMNSILVRACAYPNPPDMQTMVKYHTLVLEALGDEMRYMRKLEYETGEPMETNYLVKHFMLHVLYGTRGYGIEDSLQSLARIGQDTVSVAGHECISLINDENAGEKIVDRGVRFWESVLDLSLEPAALRGFGWWARTNSVDQDTWERLMLRTCRATGGLVEAPTTVIDRASSNGNPTESGIRIIELILRADKNLLVDLAVQHALDKIQKNGASIDVS